MRDELSSVGLTDVAFTQPWWISGGTTGTLVYNSTLTTMLGFGEAHSILDYGWMALVEGGQAFVLNGLAAGSTSAVHVRAIPAAGAYVAGAAGAPIEYETLVSNNALLWEGQIAAKFGALAATGSTTQGKGGRFLVSGLNLFNNNATTPWLNAEPVADFAFNKLVTYAVLETAAGRTSALPTELAAAPRRPVASTASAVPGCNVTGSVCVAGSDGPCQTANDAAHAVPTVCNGDFEIMAAVCVQGQVELDALYPRLIARTKGSRVVGVIYDVASASGANTSFCSAHVGENPNKLLAKGPITTLNATGSAWQRLPMPKVSLTAGVYWIGVLFEADTTCYNSGAWTPSPPAVGPGSADAYAYQPFAAGPGAGPGISWTNGAGGGFAIYATTQP